MSVLLEVIATTVADARLASRQLHLDPLQLARNIAGGRPQRIQRVGVEIDANLAVDAAHSLDRAHPLDGAELTADREVDEPRLRFDEAVDVGGQCGAAVHRGGRIGVPVQARRHVGGGR